MFEIVHSSSLSHAFEHRPKPNSTTEFSSEPRNLENKKLFKQIENSGSNILCIIKNSKCQPTHIQISDQRKFEFSVGLIKTPLCTLHLPSTMFKAQRINHGPAFKFNQSKIQTKAYKCKWKSNSERARNETKRTMPQQQSQQRKKGSSRIW